LFTVHPGAGGSIGSSAPADTPGIAESEDDPSDCGGSSGAGVPAGSSAPAAGTPETAEPANDPLDCGGSSGAGGSGGLVSRVLISPSMITAP